MRIYGDSISGNCLKVKWTADKIGLRGVRWRRGVRGRIAENDELFSLMHEALRPKPGGRHDRLGSAFPT